MLRAVEQTSLEGLDDYILDSSECIDCLQIHNKGQHALCSLENTQSREKKLCFRDAQTFSAIYVN